MLTNGDQVVANRAIVWDGLAICGDVTAIVATEAARPVHVTKIVRIRTPGDIHLRKYVSQINRLYRVNRLIEFRLLMRNDFRIVFLIVALQLLGDAFSGNSATGILLL